MLTSTLSFTALSLFFLTFFSSSEPVSASFPHDLSRRQFGRLGQGRNNGGAGGAAAAGGAGCPPLTMIVARASTEAPGEGASLSLPLFPTRSDPRLSGIIGAVADGVKEQIPGAVSVRFLPLPCFLLLLTITLHSQVAVDYPATLGNYANSEAQGVDDMSVLFPLPAPFFLFLLANSLSSSPQDRKDQRGQLQVPRWQVGSDGLFSGKSLLFPLLVEEVDSLCPSFDGLQGAQVTGDVISGGATGTDGKIGGRRLVRRQLPANSNVVAIVQVGLLASFPYPPS
jgi:hypothetical protein